ncbi:MAG: leucine-rich repeat domain-containing protein [Acidobacteriota bacterium]|nr:leucine-rich repeat domain-containing protein [Acidobacteriota bacterium]
MNTRKAIQFASAGNFRFQTEPEQAGTVRFQRPSRRHRRRMWVTGFILAFISAAFPHQTAAGTGTELCGGIFTDQTLTAAQGPYTVTCDLVVFPGVNLTIEPGVVIDFEESAGLEVRGTLTAVGSSGNEIVFQPALKGGSWPGIAVANEAGGNADLQFVTISGAVTGLSVECCWGGGPVSISDSAFNNNEIALGGYAGWDITVTRCTFTGNDKAITGADKVITDSSFTDNTFGLYNTERVDVSNSSFTGHQTALKGGRGTVSGCTISGNTTAVEGRFEGFTLTDNVITDNNRGVILTEYSNASAQVSNNDIFGNTLFNLKNDGVNNKDVSGNWWGSVDPCTIEAGILDGCDDNTLGLVHYSAVLTGPIAGAPGTTELTRCTDCAEDMIWTAQDSPHVLTENLVIFPGATLTIEAGAEVVVAAGVTIEIRGTLTVSGTQAEPVIIRGATSQKGAWDGIAVKTELGGAASIAWAEISDAATALGLDCCWEGGPVSIADTGFSNNQTALGGYAGWQLTAVRCTFTGNDTAVTGADKLITDSVFTDNTYGLHNTERVSVSGSSFTGHLVALKGGRGTVSGCTITGNTTGVQGFFEGFTLTDNVITGNEQGVILTEYSNASAPVSNNDIFGNTQFNLKNDGANNKDLSGNWWGGVDACAIEAGVVDACDENSLGRVSFSPVLAGPVADTPASVELKPCENCAADIVWTRAESPYTLNEDLIIVEGGSLTVEPGVEVILGPNVGILVRGTLTADATAEDPIVFRGQTRGMNAWEGIRIATDQGGNASLTFVHISDAAVGFSADCCWEGGPITITDSVFSGNDVGIGGYAGWDMTITRCRFTGNNAAVTGADKVITDSTFSDNGFGLSSTERVDVYNSTFTGNGTALMGGRGLVTGCELTGNDIAVQGFFEGFELAVNTIASNRVGVILSSYNTTVAPVYDNNIYGNTDYNLKMNFPANFAVNRNWWGTKDACEIEALLFDGCDDTAYGLAVYSPILDGPSAESPAEVSLIRCYQCDTVVDNQAPIIVAGPHINGVTDTGAVVSWQTDEPASTVLDYGLTGSVDTRVQIDGLRTYHAVTLEGLSPDTAYQVRASATDAEDNGPTLSEVLTFTTLSTPDTTPPLIIAGPHISEIGASEATVFWETDEAADGTVNFGILEVAENQVFDATLSTDHRFVLTELTPETTYLVSVSSSDGAGNGPATGGTVSFTTLPLADTDPPLIVEGPMVIDISDTRATVIWRTDEPAGSGVSYRHGDAFDTAEQHEPVYEHSVLLTNLSPETEYTYLVYSSDVYGNGPVLSEWASFITLPEVDTTPPVITEGPAVHGISPQSAVIRWETDEAADSMIHYGPAPETLIESKSKAQLVTHHNLPLVGLEEDTLYFFRVSSTDALGNGPTLSEIGSFYTRRRGGPKEPEIVDGPVIEQTTDTTATLFWETDQPTDSVVRYRAGGGPVQMVSNPRKTQKHRVLLVRLSPDQTYDYQITCTNLQGEQVSFGSLGGARGIASSFTTGTAPDQTSPSFSIEPMTAAVSQTGALLYWQTDEPSDSRISYGALGQPADQFAGQMELVRDHGIFLTNLIPGTSYTVEVRSADAAGNHTAPFSFELTTSMEADTHPPEFVGEIQVEDLQPNAAAITWSTNEWSDARVDFGTDENLLDNQVSISDFRTEHRVNLTYLEPGLWYYRVTCRDTDNNTVVSPVQNFTIPVMIADPAFRAFLFSLGLDTNDDGFFSIEERQMLTHLDCSNQGIADLTGIQYFPNLTSLDCSNNRLTFLPDLSALDLETLVLTRNHLQEDDCNAIAQLTQAGTTVTYNLQGNFSLLNTQLENWPDTSILAWVHAVTGETFTYDLNCP